MLQLLEPVEDDLDPIIFGGRLVGGGVARPPQREQEPLVVKADVECALEEEVAECKLLRCPSVESRFGGDGYRKEAPAERVVEDLAAVA